MPQMPRGQTGPQVLSSPLTIHQPAPAPYMHLCIDTRSCPVTKKGNKYIQVVCDYHTGYVIAWPSNSLSAQALEVEFNDKVINFTGSCQKLFSDNGANFISSTFKHACQLWGIKQVFSSAFRPSTQGITERANQTLISSLRCLVNANADDWDTLLQSVVFSINTTLSFARGVSPAHLTFGRVLLNPYVALGTAYDVMKDAPTTIQDQFQKHVALQDALGKSAAERPKNTPTTNESLL